MNSLCALLSEWDGTIPRDGALLERKWDGFRCLAFAGIDGRFRLWTRQGIPIEGCDHLLWRVKRMQDEAGEPMMFDAELVVDGTLAATKVWVETSWRKGGNAGVLHMFDAVPFRGWKAGAWDQPLFERKARLAKLIDATASEWEWRPGSHGADDPACVQLVPDEWVSDAGDVLDAAKRIWAIGGEGAVVKAWDSPYRRLRTRDWAKVKPGGPWWRKLGAGATGGKSGKD